LSQEVDGRVLDALLVPVLDRKAGHDVIKLYSNAKEPTSLINIIVGGRFLKQNCYRTFKARSKLGIKLI
jgi:hypothetical protein